MSMIETGGANRPIDVRLFRHDGVYEYTTRRGDYYRFELVTLTTPEVRVYVLAQPSYPESRSAENQLTHRQYDPQRHLHYLAVQPRPTNHAAACAWLVTWAESHSAYLRTGEFKLPEPRRQTSQGAQPTQHRNPTNSAEA